MKTAFYSKIAIGNIKKNPRLYVPRILAETGLFGCFYIMLTIALDDRLESSYGGGYLQFFMSFGAVVLGFLSFILILYVNSFLMKQRKNEYGLYNVLGMEKRHINKVLFMESLYTSVMSLVLGTAFGLLFYKLASLFVCRLLHTEVVAGFYYINFKTVLFPVLVYAGLDLIAFLINSITVRRLKPVDLLAGKHTGEKEPKIKWILLVLGVLTLGAGYFIALTIESPIDAIVYFFLAVILVIIGTYCLFVTGTTFVLKCLRKNKKYYYSKNHMVSVSGLLFRMKQNAVGLASIAILSTGVLVMISTTVSLYSGVQDVVNENYPKDLYLSAYYEKDGIKTQSVPSEVLYSKVKETADEYGLKISDYSTEQYLSVSYILRDGTLLTKSEVEGGWGAVELTGVIYITEETYGNLKQGKFGEPFEGFNLSGDEIAVCRISSDVKNLNMIPKNLTVGGTEYRVKEQLNSFPVDVRNSSLVNTLGVVVADEEVLENIYLAQKESYGDYASEYTDKLGVVFEDMEAVTEVGDNFSEEVYNRIRDINPEEMTVILDTKWEALANILDMYGTFLFLGILLGFVCLMSTILIIYYKQISEGYEDRERFQIMQKIGMEEKEVKKTIGNQLRLQFFLPLITAGVHTAVAFPILLKLLQILMLSNTALFIICTVITFTLFALVYTSVYLLTAKTYYKIVH